MNCFVLLLNSLKRRALKKASTLAVYRESSDPHKEPAVYREVGETSLEPQLLFITHPVPQGP